jgi:uncharacterized membrane protein YsdA (DUF1294 family)
MPANKKPANRTSAQRPDIPASQRTSGHLLWALLFGVFGVLLALFASGGSIAALLTGALAGGTIGYLLGKKMERDAKIK